MRVCERVFSAGLGPGLDSMSPARSRRSASYTARTHGWLPQKTGWPGLRRGGVGGCNLHSPPTVAHQPREGCIRLVHLFLSWTYSLSISNSSISASTLSNHVLLGPPIYSIKNLQKHRR